MDQNIPKKDEREIRIQRAKLKSTIKIIIWVVITFIILGGIIYLSTRPKTPRPGEEFTILGQEHISIGASHAPYNSNPPTSGPHYVQPAEWGVYQDELPDEQLIHNLEHGGIWISYKGIDDETKSKIEALVKSYPVGLVITPRLANDSPITLASWGRLLKLDDFDEEKIKEFLKNNVNKSPEPLVR
ncbi:MAG: DUF3105 domain-containing protein [Minisyncoccia bacterium]